MERAKRESFDAQTAEATEQRHPWNSLATITTFDQGNNEKSTFCLKSMTEDQSKGKITQTIKSREPQITQATVLIESLLQQLCTVIEEDKVRRKKLYYTICERLYDLQLINDPYDITEFEVLKGKYQRAFNQMLSIARGEHCPISDSVLFMPKFLIPKLRYHEEFHEICFIARGGFGEVYKAQHRLDGIEYAIKKITMPADRIEIIKQQLNEVRTLAKLNHTNIVSYNAAWIEPFYYSNVPSTSRKSYKSYTSKHHQKKSKSVIEDSFHDKNNLNFNTKDIISKRFEELDSSELSIKERITEKSNKENQTEDSSEDSIIFLQNSKSNENPDHIIIDTDTSSSSYEESSNQEVSIYTSDRQNQSYVTLYIQMALCEQTLEQWLREINVTPEPIGKAIFQQILYGVDYMHSQKIVHHDLKPSNIFISTSGQLQIQLGDFGLSCPLQIGNRHSVVGTHMYAAPEQLQGKCDPKSDIYSIGIVLIELLIPIKTQMELGFIINCLRNGKVPETLKQHKWAQMVKQLVQEDPAERPSTTQLLQDIHNDKDMIINELKDIIVNLKNDNHVKNSTIQKLEEKTVLLEEKIVILEEKVQELSIQLNII